MTTITPIDSLASRMPVVGKLRHGVYKGGRPQAIDTWRMTTSSRPFADSFAEAYGGSVAKMTNSNSPHEWEVISEATELSIALVPGGFQQSYELWSAGGCQRRCDGVTVSVLQTTGPDDVEYVESGCVCSRKGALECSLKTRLTVVLPNLAFRGGLVYETSSENFAQESRGMIALIQQLQASGITRGVLRLEKRKSTGGRRFTVAALGISESIDALQSGEAARQSLGTAPERPALGNASSERSIHATSSTGSGPSEDGGSSHSQSPAAQSGGPPSSSSASVSAADVGDGGSTGPPSPLDSPQTSEPGGDHGEGSPSGEDIVDAEIVDEPDELSAAEASKLRATFMAIVQGENCGLSYDREVAPFLEANYGATWSGLPAGEKRRLVAKLTPPKRIDKEANQKAFARVVKEWHGTVAV